MATWLAQCFRSKWASAACLLVVALAAVLPLNGPPLPLCQFKSTTQLPCFGCGLTRSFIGMGHLNVSRAALYHPVGVLLFPVVALIALLLPAPAAVRERLARWAERHRRALNGVAWAGLALFLFYGFGRLALCAWLRQQGQPYPW